ncbi:MAG: purine/pyrimidine permease [Bryobacterales bacterium]|nr:purine/pyrimidine permease [Bryobacterales bacterium]
MTRKDPTHEHGLRYQADDNISLPLALGLGLQLTALIVSIPILIPTVVLRAAGASEAYLSWAVFAAVAICGAATMLQARRIGRLGAGYVIIMSSSTAFIGPSIDAIESGGAALLVTLVVVASLFQFLLSARLALFRRILTPTVSGAVLMLVPVTAMPSVLGMLDRVPDGSPAHVAPLCAIATVLVIAVIALKASGALRLWAPVIGVVAGSVVGALFGLYDFGRIDDAPWVGLPDVAWPGIDLDFGPAFWSLLPPFLLVTLIVTLRSISSSVAVQSVSWRQKRAVDFRAVQGAVNVDGISNLLCGLAGTVPNTGYSVSAALAELTGVAARRVGIATGAMFVVLAFFPKALAAVLAIPGPVVGGYLGVLMAMLFLVGIKVLVQDGLEYRKGLIVGIAFWIGLGFEIDMIFPEQAAAFAGGLFSNAMTTGGLAAILMTLFVELTKSRRLRMASTLELSALPKISEFLRSFAKREGWHSDMADRLEAVGEECLLNLVPPEDEAATASRPRRLRLVAYRDNVGAVLEFTAAPSDDNIQDQLVVLGDLGDDASIEHEASLRLLRHLASSVRHQQYHDIDIVTVHVKVPTRAAES